MRAENPVWPGLANDVPTADPRALEALSQLAAGRTESLEVLYELFARDLYGLALFRTGSREDAADVVHDVFVKLAGIGARLRRIRDPRSYLLVMTRRAAIDRLRRRRGADAPTEAMLEPIVEHPERAADADRLSRLLGRLPAAQRETLYLRFFQDMTFRQIGLVTGVSTFTAASRHRLALRRLRRELGRER